MSTRNLAIPFIVAGMLVTGTINTVITKMIFNIGKAPGCCGWQSNGVPNDQPHNFAHPWFNTWIMFLGELLCFIPFILSRPSAKKQDSLVRNTQGPKTENPYSYIFAIPTICDLTASTLGNVALLWVDASIWQMMRGAIIIFGAILSLLVLKKKLYMHHWIGIGLVVIGLFLVGLAGMLKQSATSTSNLFYVGITLVIFAQLIAATQMIIEELLLKERSYEPLNVVFMEGFWGVIITAAVALPVLSLVSASPVSPLNYTNAQANPWIDIFSENVADGVTQMINRPVFFYENLILLFSIAFYNFFGLSLARYLSTVHRTLIDACRTVSVWAIQVIFFYIDFVGAGEKLQLESLLQLAGFIFLVIGTIVYNEVIKIPGSYYEVPQKKGVN